MAKVSAESSPDLVVCDATVAVDAHVVEIPVDQDQGEDLRPSDPDCMNTHVENGSSPSCSPAHPLEEIGDSRGHLLLLKLWQREEEVLARRIEVKEYRIESIRKEVFQMGCFYFAFHGIVLTLLFTSAIHGNADTCVRWWIPSSLSLITSLVIICAIQYKLIVQGRVLKMLQRDKTDSRALCRCIQELRMKGASFDLSKEPQTVKRMKSSSVENALCPLRWCSQYCVALILALSTGLILPSCKFIVCS